MYTLKEKEFSMFRLDKKIALVTGAGSGIGREIALLFAKSGATVLVADVQAEAASRVVEEIHAQEGKARVLALDVRSEEEVQAAIASVAQEYGRLDIIVNNAGVSHVGNIVETSVEDWDRVMSVNARGVFICAKHAVKQMLAQEPAGGVIINMASAAGLIGVERRFPYSTSKGAVISITRSIAIDYATQKIRCNAICPGTVHTPFVDGYLARDFPGREQEMMQQLHDRQPIGRMGLPGEIAAAALYLASDEAAFVTGSTLVIDGGWTAK
jgi:2-keto-3-deoxy-L-fuconate dehydrogenase